MTIARDDENPGTSSGPLLSVDDPDLVVQQGDLVDLRIERAYRLAQRGIDGVDGSITFRNFVRSFSVDLELHGRLGRGTARALGAIGNVISLRLDERLMDTECSTKEQFEGGFGSFKLPTLGFE